MSEMTEEYPKILSQRESSTMASTWNEYLRLTRPTIAFKRWSSLDKGADEALGDAGLHTNTGDARRELCPKGISDRPTARVRAEGKLGQQTPLSQVRSLTGRRPAPDIGQPGYTVLECAPLEPRPSAMREGRGGKRKAELWPLPLKPN
jgi:hypothetical protein